MVTTSAPAAAEPADEVSGADAAADLDEEFVIDAVLIEGLFRTKPYVVMRELLFAEGETTTRAELEESVQRLRNLGLFRVAEYELLDRRIPLPDGSLPSTTSRHRILLITVDERWTIIPFGTFSAGGGTFSLTSGLYDINLLGRYIELGGQYQRFADTNSFAIWASDPRLFGERLKLSATLAQTNRINVFYADDGTLEGGHMRLRRSAAISLSREWSKLFTTGANIAYVDDRYSLRLLTDELRDLEAARGLPEAAHYLSLGLSAAVGRINADSYLRRGLQLAGSVATAQEPVASNLSYLDTAVQLRAFEVLPWKINVGFRTGLGTTSMDRPEYQFFVGGFNLLRGFLHRRFRGSHYWYANGELRVPSLDTRWLALQHVAFVDAAAAGEGFDVLGEVDGVSAGLGLRFMSPKIFSLLGRIDYAWPIYGDGTSALSFGAGQFF